MKIEIEDIIEKDELLPINTIIASVPNGSLKETFDFITKARNQEYFLAKAGLKVGMGGHHIWVSNRKGERILLITE